MIVLDENIRHDQGEKLRKFGIRARWLTSDVAHAGIKDSSVIPLLHAAHRATFFTHDQDYHKRRLCHDRYCLVWLDVFDGDAALYIRAFVKHPEFNTAAKRMGVVARVVADRVQYWRGEHSSIVDVKLRLSSTRG